MRIMPEAQPRVFAREVARIQDTPVGVFRKKRELRINITDKCATDEPGCLLRARVFLTVGFNPVRDYDVIWFIVYDVVYFLQSLGSEQFIISLGV